MTTNRSIFSFLGTLCAIFFLWSCGPQTSEETTDEDSIAVNIEEAESMTSVAETEGLLLTAMMNNMMYATLGEIASEKASSQEVKDFAGELAGSSEEVVAKINQLYEAVGGDAPQVLGVEQQAKVDSLRELPPDEFDQAFVNLVEQAHQDDIESMQSLKAESENPVVRGLAADAETLMQTQLEKANTLEEEPM